jgi:hypothetical protein
MTLTNQLNLAMLALKGNRFEEAEGRFADIAERAEEPTAWVGLASAKMGRLLGGEVTIDELESCFDIARQLCENDDSRRSVEDVAATRAIATILQLLQQFAKLRELAGDVRDKAMLATVAGALATFTGTSSSSLFGTFASYNVFSRSVDVFESTLDDTHEICEAARRVEDLILQLSAFVRRFASEPSAVYTEALGLLDQIDAASRGTATNLKGPSLAIKQLPAFNWRTCNDDLSGSDLFETVGEWHIRIQDKSYLAPDFATVYEWVEARRVPGTALLWHSSLSSWTAVFDVEPLRDALGLPARRGMFLVRCPSCQGILVAEVSDLHFSPFNETTLTCQRCSKALRLSRSALTPHCRLWRARQAEASSTRKDSNNPVE